MKISKEYIHVLLSFLLFLIVAAGDTFFAENTFDYELNRKTLVDVIHNNFPKIKDSIATAIVFLLLGYSFFRFIFIDPSVVTYMFILISIMFFFRIFAFTITQVPPTYVKGDKDRNQCRRTVLNHVGFSLTKSDSGCTDYMFSAHTAITIIAGMMVILFSKYPLEVALFACIIPINLFLISSSRLHYTSDVYISTIITSLLLVALPFKHFVHGINQLEF